MVREDGACSIRISGTKGEGCSGAEGHGRPQLALGTIDVRTGTAGGAVHATTSPRQRTMLLDIRQRAWSDGVRAAAVPIERARGAHERTVGITVECERPGGITISGRAGAPAGGGVRQPASIRGGGARYGTWGASCS